MNLTNQAGDLRFSLRVMDGQPQYAIDRITEGEAKALVRWSPLGLTRSDANFTEALAWVDASSPTTVQSRYDLRAGKVAQVDREGIESTVTLANPLGGLMTLTVRLYDDGVAFRYGFPGHGSQQFRITDERTGFHLVAGAKVWTQPYSKVDTWAPGYEADYVNGVPAGTAAPGAEGWCLPLLFESEGAWGLITETDLEPSYFASHLQPDAPDGLYRIRLPEEPETYGVAPQEAVVTLPWNSPWRVLVFSDRAGGISESTLVTDLARPADPQDTSWIQPGMATWSWWSDMNSPRSFKAQQQFVDTAAALGWRYCLVDLGWQDMAGGDIQQLVDYAAPKGVGILVWYNSAGKHNQVPDAGPRDIMNDPVKRDAEFARLARIGVKGVKVDFMQSDKQFVVALYHDILRDAARHHLLVNFHGATVPRGWDRTYPNLMTMEAVRGAEQYWDKTFAAQAHQLHTIYAFTRNAIGPMDYTPTILTDPGASNPQLQKHLTTAAHELALLVVFQSGIQHVVDPASSLDGQPDYVRAYLHAMPTAWEESHYLAGAPGEFAVVARRSGQTWYIGAINGSTESRVVTVPCAFLEGATGNLLAIEDAGTDAGMSPLSRVVAADDVLHIQMAGRGGFAGRIVQP